METFSNWLGLAVSIATILLLWTLRWRSQGATHPQLSQLVEMEDALKEAYKLQQTETVAKAEALAGAISISVAMVESLMETLVAFTRAEGDVRAG